MSFLVEKHASSILPFIATLFNKSLAGKVFLEAFKNTIVKTLLKKVGLDGLDMKNFCPVYNLFFISKLLENTVHSRMIAHLEVYDMMLRNQSAYHNNPSTETAVLKIFSDITSAIDSHHLSVLCLLNLPVVFDTVDNDYCSRILYGFTGRSLEWLHTYFNRAFSMQFGGSLDVRNTSVWSTTVVRSQTAVVLPSCTYCSWRMSQRNMAATCHHMQTTFCCTLIVTTMMPQQPVSSWNKM